MIDFVSRHYVFEQNPTLARVLYEFQKSSFGEEETLYEVGEQVYLELEDEEPTTLTAEQVQSLNKEYEDSCASMCDVFADEPERVVFSGQVIAELEAADFSQFCKQIGPQLENLCVAMAWERLLVLPFCKSAYLVQENDSPPLQVAETALLNLGIERDYCDGLVLEGEMISYFFSLIFWIVRCNASAPYICFAAPGSPLIGTLCKYGNIHFDCYGQEGYRQLLEGVNKTGFVVAEEGVCVERFSDTGAIEGRRLDL